MDAILRNPRRFSYVQTSRQRSGRRRILGLAQSRFQDGPAAPGPRQGLQPDGGPDPGLLPGRQHGPVLGRAPRALAAPPRPRARSHPAHEQPVPEGGGRRQLQLRRRRLLRPPARRDGVRGAGPLQHREPEPRPGRPAHPDPGAERDAVLLSADARGPRPGPGLHRAGRRARQREEGPPHRRLVAEPVRGRPERGGPRPAPRRPALHRGRRAAQGLPGPGPRRGRLPAPRLHPRAEVRRQPAQQQLLEHRAAEAGRDPRSGPGPDRRPERREPRAVPAIQGAPHQRRLPHRRRPVPRSPGAGGEAHLVPSLGRRPVRAPHRERERGQPRPGARPRAPQGAGHAAGPGRLAVAGGPPARDREPGAEPGRRGRRPPGGGRRPAHARQLRPARIWPTPATSAWTVSPPSTRSPSPWPSAS